MSGGLAWLQRPVGKKGYKSTLELTHGLTFGTIRERNENVSFEQLPRLEFVVTFDSRRLS